MITDILVLYHGGSGGCLDGHASAWAVWDYYNRNGSNYVMELVPVTYGDPIPDLTGKLVYIVDMSFDPEALVKAAEVAERVILLDHHESAHAKWVKYTDEGPSQSYRIELVMGKESPDGNRIERFEAGKVVAYFATKMSGAVLTWRYLNIDEQSELVLNNDEAPLLLRYCQDWDIHTLKLQGVKEITAALYAKSWIREQNFAAFGEKVETVQLEHIANLEYHEPHKVEGEEFNAFISNDVLIELHREGKVVYDYQVTMANAMIGRTMKMVTLNGYEVPMMYCPRELRTIAGGIMAAGYPFSVCYEDYHPEGIREYSFRSDKNDPKAVNVKEIAESHGGGGHIPAAGVRTSVNDTLLWQLPKNWNASSPHD